MSESNKPFTVKDRRHFTPEGDVRKEPSRVDEAGAAADDASPPPPAEERPAEPAPAAEKDAPASPTPGEGDAASAATSSDPEAREARDAGPADFGQFLLSLGAQAGMLLSGQGLPEGTDASEALAGARSLISILEMLKDKTEGRRTAQEDEILEGLLYELRMAYVEKSRAGGS
jgi:hypothetical protein